MKLNLNFSCKIIFAIGFIILNIYQIKETSAVCVAPTGPKYNVTKKMNAFCAQCKSSAPTLLALFRSGDVNRTIAALIQVCYQGGASTLSTCTRLVLKYKFAIVSSLEKTTLSGIEICKYVLGCDGPENPAMLWDIPLPNTPKPFPITPKKPKFGAHKLRVLHLADIHIDYKYTPGNVANCIGIICCRNDSTVSNPNITATYAGYWGGQGLCDIPLWTVENMFDHISKNEKFDVIYWTGDLVPHDMPDQSKEYQLENIRKLSNLFAHYFPNKTVYATLGNHEAYPGNLYPTDPVHQDNITWLYEEVAKDWIFNGLTSDTVSTIIKGGYYTTLIAPGFRLVSLNMNFCYEFNFWLYINSTDPLDQLAWLAQVLQNSEDNCEKVHIIGHEFPSSCLLGFGQNYYKIVNRYESTIAGQFFGHSHSDFFEIFYDINQLGKATRRPTNVAFIGPSVTTYKDSLRDSVVNPAFRIYDIDGLYDGSSFGVLSHETRIMDLKRANEFNDTTWKTEYETTIDYNLNSLFPNDMANFVNTMLNNLSSPLTEKYINYYSKSSFDAATGCDLQCRVNYICRLKQARYDYFVPCN